MGITKDLRALQDDWNEWGKADPLWAILSAKDKQANKWDVSEFFAVGRREIEQVMSHIRSLGMAMPSRKALDFGCGVGRLSQALAEDFGEVCGVDIAPSMLELAKKYNQHVNECKYYLNTVNDLNLFPSNYFDFIYSSLTLQHMEPQYSKNYIREFLRVLEPGGVLVFQLLGERKGWRVVVKGLLPLPVLDLYYRVRLGHPPTILMYGIPQNEVVELLRTGNARAVDIQQSKTNAGWLTCRYFVVKDQAR